MSDDLQQVYEEAQALTQKGDYMEAAKMYQRIIENRPELAEAHLNQGACYFRAGELEQGLTAFESAIALDSKLFSAHFNKGKILARMGDYEQAAGSFEKALELKADPRIYEDMAHAYNKTQQFEKALDTAAKGIEANKEKFLETLHNERIFAFFKLNRPVDALEDVEAVLKEKDWDKLRKEQVGLYAAVITGKGHSLMDAGKFAEAVEFFERVNAVDPTASRLSAHGLCLAQALKFHESLPVLNKAHKLDPKNKMTLKALALVYTELREYGKGVKFFELLFEDESEKADVDMMMGFAVCLMNLNRRDEAQEPLEFVYGKDKSRWVAAGLLGAIYLVKERIEEAAQVLDDSVKHSNGKTDDTVHYNYGYALLKLSRLEEALEQFETALKKNPDNAAAKEAIEIIKAELAEREKVEQEEQEIREKEQAKQLAEQKQREEQQKAEAAKLKAEGGSGEGSEKKGIVDDYFDKKKPNYRITQGGERRKPRGRVGTRIAVLQKNLQPQLSTKPYYRRKSLEVIPQGIAYEGAVSYAKWFNKQMAEDSDDEEEKQD